MMVVSDFVSLIHAARWCHILRSSFAVCTAYTYDNFASITLGDHRMRTSIYREEGFLLHFPAITSQVVRGRIISSTYSF